MRNIYNNSLPATTQNFSFNRSDIKVICVPIGCKSNYGHCDDRKIGLLY